MRLKYAMQTGVTNIVTTGAFSYVFRGNSVFDPDFTSTGGQPANYDDWAALYGNYRVWGSTITIHLLTSTASTEPISWVMAPRHASTALTSSTFYDAASMPYAKVKLQNIYRTGAKDASFRSTMSSAKFLGLSRAEFEGKDDTTAAVGANPGLPWYWHVTAINVDSSVTSEVAIQVEIVYDVEFFNRLETSLDSRLDSLMGMRVAFENANKSKSENGGRHTGEKVSARTQRLTEIWRRLGEPPDQERKSEKEYEVIANPSERKRRIQLDA